MKKVLYITRKEVPYKVSLFNELAKKFDFTVIFQTQKTQNRNSVWAKSIKNNFKFFYIDEDTFGKIFPTIKMLKLILKKYDEIIFGCINDKSQLIIMTLMRILKKPYIINLDGEIYFTGNKFKSFLKKFFLKGAKYYFVAGEKSMVNIKNIVNKEVIPYYFSSLTKSDIEKNSLESKQSRENYILVVGQYFEYKGLDIVVKIAKELPELKFKFIGMGFRTKEFLNLVKEVKTDNIETIPFLQREELNEEYKKCKMLVLPSRKECWGLVINEAASFGTPIVSTYGSGAAIEFLENSPYSCFLAEPNNENDLKNKILELNKFSKIKEYSEYLIQKSQKYNIENSANIHIKRLEGE